MTLENITKSIRILDLEGTKTVEIKTEYLVQLIEEHDKLSKGITNLARRTANAEIRADNYLAQRLQPCAKKFDEVV